MATVKPPPSSKGPPIQVSKWFRVELAHVLPYWESDGVIQHSEAERLSADYHLDEIINPPVASSTDEPDRATMANRILFLLGGLLVGCGIIAFVAANWATMSGMGKAIILNTGMLSLYFSGYLLWFKKGMVALGHGLIFAGAIAFGADLGLMAQGFHISLPNFTGYGVWALGSLILAVALRSKPIVALSLFGAAIWLVGGIARGLPPEANLERFCTAAALLGVGAFVCQFRWLYSFAYLAAAVGTIIYVGETTQHAGWTAIAVLVHCAFLASYAAAPGKNDERKSMARGLQVSAYVGLFATAAITAASRIALALDDPSMPEVEAPTWVRGAYAILALAMISLGTGLSAAWKIRLDRVQWILVSAWTVFAIGIGMAALGPVIGIDNTSSVLLAAVSGLGFVGCLLISSARFEIGAWYGAALLTLATFSIEFVVFAGGTGGFPFAAICLIVLAGLWATLPAVFRLIPRTAKGKTGYEFAAISWLILGGTAFVASFHDVWRLVAESIIKSELFHVAAPQGGLLIGIIAAITATMAGVQFAWDRTRYQVSGVGKALAACGAAILVAAFVALFSADYWVPTALSILATMGFGSCLVAAGLSKEQRPLYWLGSCFLILMVLIRFFEYETSQLAKSVAFLVSGVLVLVAGTYFERRHRIREVNHVHTQ